MCVRQTCQAARVVFLNERLCLPRGHEKTAGRQFLQGMSMNAHQKETSRHASVQIEVSRKRVRCCIVACVIRNRKSSPPEATFECFHTLGSPLGDADGDHHLADDKGLQPSPYCNPWVPNTMNFPAAINNASPARQSMTASQCRCSPITWPPYCGIAGAPRVLPRPTTRQTVRDSTWQTRRPLYP